MELLLLGRSASDECRTGMVQPDKAGIVQRGSAGAGVFLEPGDLFENGSPASPIFGRPRNTRPAAFGLASLPGQHKIARCGTVEGGRSAGNIGPQPGTRFQAEGCNGLGIVIGAHAGFGDVPDGKIRLDCIFVQSGCGLINATVGFFRSRPVVREDEARRLSPNAELPTLAVPARRLFARSRGGGNGVVGGRWRSDRRRGNGSPRSVGG